jgi:agmatinase
MTKEELIAQFDPNGPGTTGALFGLPFTPETAEVVVIPIPWEVTVSYRTGTAGGPQAILNASSQVDLSLKEIPDAWKLGISMLQIPINLQEESSKLRELSSQHIRTLETGEKLIPNNPIVSKINEASENLNVYVKSTAQKWLKENKMVGLVGGDHSTPLGFLRALSERYDRFGILQIDAHADLRKAYEGFMYSHASIMFNAMKLPSIGRLVQVGTRDYCDEELQVMDRSMGRIKTYFDHDIKQHLYEGQTWASVCDQIVQDLPQQVYISFDIDGLNAKLCPNTGTPVAGGLEFEQAIYLIERLVKSGKQIIGFDLSEVAPGNDDWDANVGARLLYHLCHWMGVSQNKLKAKS